MRKNRKVNSVSYTSNVLLNMIYAVYSLVCVVPLILVFMVSITEESSVYQNGYSLFPKAISLNTYRFLFLNSDKIIKGYGVTIFATVIGTGLSLLVTSLLAYALSRKSFRYRQGLSLYVYFTMLFNGGLVPYYLVWTQIPAISVRNSIWAFVLPGLISGFNILLVRSYFNTNIPDSLIESAKIDGAGELRIFSFIVLPLAKPVLATIGLFSIMGYWNDFFRNMLFISDDKYMNLQYLLYQIQNNIQTINGNPELAAKLGGTLPSETTRMAMVIITIGPLIFAYPFLQKYFVKGLTIGAVKG